MAVLLKRVAKCSVLTLLLLASGCGKPLPNDGVPKDYEFDNTVTNETGDVYYEIFVGSFADSNGDGYGDLNGIRDKLDYLKDMGVGGIWLTPIHPSPSYHGYDVEDYKAVNAHFGTLTDFKNMMTKANELHIDVILDLVVNHTSRTHPWFTEGLNRFKNGTYDPSDNNDKANYYNFYWDNGEVKYTAGFGEWMPDLNLDNPAVRNEIVSIMKFWFDYGVKGYRLDAARYFYEMNTAKNIEFLRFLKTEANKIRSDNYFVGEAWGDPANVVAQYYTSGIDSFFNFDGADSNGYIISDVTTRKGSRLGSNIVYIQDLNRTSSASAITGNFLTNHDMNRSATMWVMNQEQRRKLGASVYMLQPGRPFIYYGEEIGLKGKREEEPTDANRRLPMQWQQYDDTYRPANPPGATYKSSDQIKEGVKEMLEMPFSLTNHYKKVINVRNKYPFITNAKVESTMVRGVDDEVTYLKIIGTGDEVLYVFHNIGSVDHEVNLNELGLSEVLISDDIFTSQIRAKLLDNVLTLAPYSSVILKDK